MGGRPWLGLQAHYHEERNEDYVLITLKEADTNLFLVSISGVQIFVCESLRERESARVSAILTWS